MQVSKDMAAAVDAGVNSFKFFFAYKGALMVSDELYLNGLLRCKELGALPMVNFSGHSRMLIHAYHHMVMLSNIRAGDNFDEAFPVKLPVKGGMVGYHGN